MRRKGPTSRAAALKPGDDKFADFRRMRVIKVLLCLGLVPALCFGSGARAGESSSFTRSGSDQLSTRSLASGSTLSFTYDQTYGQIMGIADTSGFSLSIISEGLLHLPLSQTVTENGERF